MQHGRVTAYGVASGAPGAWQSCSHVPGASCADEAECSGDGGCVRLWPRDAQPKGPIPFPRDKPGMYPAPGVLGTEQIHPFWCHEQSHDRPRCITQCSECADDGDGVALPRTVNPPEFQEVTWGVDSVMRPCKSMAISEYAFRQWAKDVGIVLADGVQGRPAFPLMDPQRRRELDAASGVAEPQPSRQAP